jgi:tetratricopeptide (TPR) repeat protein
VPNDYELPVLLTWGPSLAAAEQACPAARPLLELLAFFSADPLPRTMLAAAPEALPEPLRDPLALDDAVVALTRFSLVTAAQEMLVVHRLVHAVVRDRLAPELAAARAECAVRLAAAGWPKHMRDQESWSAVQARLPHALAAARAAATHAPTIATTSHVLDRAATYLEIRGAYAEAAPLFEQAVAIDEKTLGPEHPDLATRLNNLALLYQDTGRLAEAEPLFKRALAIGEKSLPPDHPHLMTGLKNYAGLLDQLGRGGEAAELQARAEAIRQWREHPPPPPPS